MPLIAPALALIEEPVSDRSVQDTLIRQKARFVSLYHEQLPGGHNRNVVRVAVSLYAAAGADFGPLLDGPGFTGYTVEIKTDNHTLVDMATGAILAIRDQETDEEWQTLLASYEQPVMLQSDYFEYLRDNVAFKIGDMIRQHIQQADAMGRFA